MDMSKLNKKSQGSIFSPNRGTAHIHVLCAVLGFTYKFKVVAIRCYEIASLTGSTPERSGYDYRVQILAHLNKLYKGGVEWNPDGGVVNLTGANPEEGTLFMNGCLTVALPSASPYFNSSRSNRFFVLRSNRDGVAQLAEQTRDERLRVRIPSPSYLDLIENETSRNYPHSKREICNPIPQPLKKLSNTPPSSYHSGLQVLYSKTHYYSEHESCGCLGTGLLC